MIYCVEDDRGIREIVVYTLRNSNFEAEGFENSKQLYDALKKQTPELILLDIMLPEEDGLEILSHLRTDSTTKKVPVIMVTAMGTEFDKVIALDKGADDYITKPFGMMELVARIKAVLRRADKSSDSDQYSYGKVLINLRSHAVSVNGLNIELTIKEFELLLLLIKNQGTVFDRDALLAKIWGYDFDGETRTVDVHIRTLRAKLGEDGDIIETIRGVGYRIGSGK